MAAALYKTVSGRLFHAGAIAIITVGLPARGKTHVSRSLCRYLRWLGVKTKVFSLGDYRRHVMGTPAKLPMDFFSPANHTTAEARQSIADACQRDMVAWFEDGGQVGIYDASNTTQARRLELQEELLKHDIHPVFIESVCDNMEIIEANIRSVKISSPDYVGWDPEEAFKDYWSRINHHLPYYETITDTSMNFVKLINVGEKIIVNDVKGYLQSRIVYYLMNLHVSPRTIYFARAGESFNEASNKADAGLTPNGFRYARNLEMFMRALRERKMEERRKQGWREKDLEKPLIIWSSTRTRSMQTAQPFMEAGYRVLHRSVLTELNRGVCETLLVEDIKDKFPEEYSRAQQDPYHHRYPRAESYHDLAVRLESVILELEREKNDVLIIGAESVLKCLYGYLFDRNEEEIPHIEIPRGYLVEITPSAYGCLETRLKIPDHGTVAAAAAAAAEAKIPTAGELARGLMDPGGGMML